MIELDYESAREHLSKSRNPNHRRIANNTVLETRDDGIALRLHATDVATFHADGTITLDSGGWLTVTTKDRMNYVLGIGVYSNKGRWFVSFLRDRHFDESNVWPFFDGMRLDVVARRVVNASDGPDIGAQDRANKATRKAIASYVALYADARIAELVAQAQQDNALGDCLLCQMGDAPGDDPEHLRLHIEEGYVMVSTVHNAVKAKGYPNPVVILSYAPDLARRALTTYLRKRLLVGAQVTR